MPKGYFLISDISGYTVYLTESELEHAKETLTSLLSLLIDHTRPPLRISRLEGDAVISYALQDSFHDGQTYIELVEKTYVAFRQAIERLVLNNTCQCNACANVSNLDLKFFTHYGEFSRQAIGEHQELVGTDVNLVHRLLKNSIKEQTGIHAYALYTDAAVQQLKLEGMRAGMVPHRERHDPFGDVDLWIQDLHPVWRERREEQTTILPPEDIRGEIAIEIDMPPELVWEYLNRPEFRSQLFGSDRQVVRNRSEGRIGPGSVYQCYHGDLSVPHTILEWEPFDRIVTKEVLPIPIEGTRMYAEYRFQPTQRGTSFSMGYAQLEGPLLGRAMFALMSPFAGRLMTGRLRAFKELIEADLRHQTISASTDPGPSGKEIGSAASVSLLPEEGTGKP